MRLIKNHSLQAGDFDGFAAARIFAAQLVIQAYPIVPRFFEFCPIPFVAARGKAGLLGSSAPFDGVFQRGPALWAVNSGGYRFILFVKQISFFHRGLL